MRTLADIKISSGALPRLTVTCFLLLAMPIAFVLFWRKKKKGQLKLRYLFAGAAGFIVSARVLELGVHIFCIVLDNPVSRFINGSDAAYVLYGITMAGFFEEVGRYVILKYFTKKDRTRENAVLYGIGHGGIEVLTVTFPVYFLYLLINVLLRTGDASLLCKLLNVTEDAAPALLPTVKTAASFGIGAAAAAVLERFICMFVHIGLTVSVHYGIQAGKKRYLLYAVLLHMAVDILPAMYQRGLVSVWVCEAWIFFVAAVIMIIAVKLYRRQAETASLPQALAEMPAAPEEPEK